MRLKRTKRGFFSFITGALAAFLFITMAALISSTQWSGGAGLAELDARYNSERGEDAVRFLNQTLLDALFDAVYSNCGCGASPLSPENIFSNYSNYSAAYANASLSNLSTQFTSVNATISLASFAVSSCNASFQANASATIRVASAYSKKMLEANYSFSSTIYRDAAEFNATAAGLAVRVQCA